MKNPTMNLLATTIILPVSAVASAQTGMAAFLSRPAPPLGTFPSKRSGVLRPFAAALPRVSFMSSWNHRIRTLRTTRLLGETLPNCWKLTHDNWTALLTTDIGY
jgi:hypothetical protein